MSKEGRSPWFYILLGCGGLVLVIVAGVAVVGFLGFNAVKNMEQTMRDPVARAQKAQEVLHANALPEGYNAQAALSVPFVGDFISLSDQEPDSKGQIKGFDSQGLFYMNMRRMGDMGDQMDRFFKGESDDPNGVMSNMQIPAARSDMRSGDVLGRGSFAAPDYEADYVLMRGTFRLNNRDADTLSNMTRFLCPNDDRLRMAIWFAKSPVERDEPLEGVDLTGTPGDLRAVQDLLANFRPCG